MTTVRVLAAGLVIVVTAQSQAQQQAPMFRSSANAVAVDVAVRDRNRRAITNLQPADFEVQDKGVAQTVENLSYGKLPIDVTIALDVSYSVTGLVLERLRRGVLQLMGDLGNQDRLKLVLFNQRVSRIVDFTGDVKEVERAMRNVTAGGSTALLDAVSVALVSTSTPDRRHLVVFFTDGSDSTSVTTPASLQTTARRARATLTFVMPSTGTVTFAPLGASSANATQIIRSTTSTLRVDSIYDTLARDTGGSVVPVFPSTDLSAAFRQVLDQFRTTYVLYFNAKGVEPGGYHALEVKVRREGATVQARRGYWY